MESYCDGLSDGIPENSRLLFDFFWLIGNSKEYIALNFPSLSCFNDSSPITNLQQTLLTHPIVGLFISHLVSHLYFTTSKTNTVALKALKTFRNILFSHQLHPSFQQHSSYIVSTYFSFIPMVIFSSQNR